MQLSQELSTGNIQSTSPRKKFNIYLLICLIVVLVITIPVIIVLAVKLSNKSDDYDEKEKEFNSLKENYNKLDNDKTSLDKQFNSLKNDYNSLQDDYKELNDTKTNLDKELKDAKEENAELSNKLETEKAENEILKKNNTELDNELKDVKDNYEQLKSQYSKQNNTLNYTFNSLQNFISTANLNNSKFNKEDYQNVKEKLEFATKYEDGRYDFNIYEAEALAIFTSTVPEPVIYEQGYQVAFETDSKNWENYYSNEEYDDIVYNLAYLVGVEPNIDVKDYKSKISFHIEDLDTSLSIAALFNQESIYNWANETYIPNSFYQP